MVNSEIRILLDEEASAKQQGEVLEKLVKWILQSHQYDVKENIHFTGLEIDLVASHRHKKETLYVECKAREKVHSVDIKNFLFNFLHKEPDYAYFISTKEIEQQAGALIEEIRNNSKYKNVTFFEPGQIIDILTESFFIKEPSEIAKRKVTKRILCLTYLGDFFVYVINDSAILPTSVVIINANTNDDVRDEDVINLICNKIVEVKTLRQEFLHLQAQDQPERKASLGNEIENISEVQSSAKWHDYLPASSKHFVGRDHLRTQFFDFFKEVANNATAKRVFYLTGKSGWGKSSLMVEIKERCRNKFYKNRFFTIAIDSRSATSDNFVALSFERLIRNASHSGFIAVEEEVEFVSNVDLFKSQSVKNLLSRLKVESKYLVLIFDQFEDVFRKEGLFKSFYKFLSDVTDLEENIIVGFSWKTEILIPSDNEAYHYWQQAKEQAVHFTVPEFGTKEISGIIKQLESSTGKIVDDLQRRIKESSQGLPWLTKKLCIHIYDQLQAGLTQEQLIDENLNIEELFRNDLEKLDGPETEALKFIAKRAYDGNFFEVSEVGDKIQEQQLDSLRDKRLIIRSGANYNIYWDIFRDYLVTKEVPQIGEAFILRYGVNTCLTVFSLFESDSVKYSLDELQQKHPKAINKATLENVLIELRNIGLVKKIDNTDQYKIAIVGLETSEMGLKKFIQEKFKRYSPYIKLTRIDNRRITVEDVLQALKDVFKGFVFKENTWSSYCNVLASWFKFADLKLVKNIQGRTRNRSLAERREDDFIRTSPTEVVEALDKLFNGERKLNGKIKRDFFLLNLLDNNGNTTEFAYEIYQANSFDDQKNKLLEQVLFYDKMQFIQTIVIENPKLKAKQLLGKLPSDFFGQNKESSKITYITTLKSWFKDTRVHSKGTNTNVFLLSSLSGMLKAVNSIKNGGSISRHAMRDMKIIGILDSNNLPTDLGSELIVMSLEDQILELRKRVLESQNYQKLNELMIRYPGIKTSKLHALLPQGFFENPRIQTQKNYLSIMSSWLKSPKGYKSQFTSELFPMINDKI